MLPISIILIRVLFYSLLHSSAVVATDPNGMGHYGGQLSHIDAPSVAGYPSASTTSAPCQLSGSFQFTETAIPQSSRLASTTPDNNECFSEIQSSSSLSPRSATDPPFDPYSPSTVSHPLRGGSHFHRGTAYKLRPNSSGEPPPTLDASSQSSSVDSSISGDDISNRPERPRRSTTSSSSSIQDILPVHYGDPHEHFGNILTSPPLSMAPVPPDFDIVEAMMETSAKGFLLKKMIRPSSPTLSQSAAPSPSSNSLPKGLPSLGPPPSCSPQSPSSLPSQSSSDSRSLGQGTIGDTVSWSSWSPESLMSWPDDDPTENPVTSPVRALDPSDPRNASRLSSPVPSHYGPYEITYDMPDTIQPSSNTTSRTVGDITNDEPARTEPQLGGILLPSEASFEEGPVVQSLEDAETSHVSHVTDPEEEDDIFTIHFAPRDEVKLRRRSTTDFISMFRSRPVETRRPNAMKKHFDIAQQMRDKASDAFDWPRVTHASILQKERKKAACAAINREAINHKLRRGMVSTNGNRVFPTTGGGTFHHAMFQRSGQDAHHYANGRAPVPFYPWHGYTRVKTDTRADTRAMQRSQRYLQAVNGMGPSSIAQPLRPMYPEMTYPDGATQAMWSRSSLNHRDMLNKTNPDIPPNRLPLNRDTLNGPGGDDWSYRWSSDYYRHVPENYRPKGGWRHETERQKEARLQAILDRQAHEHFVLHVEAKAEAKRARMAAKLFPWR